MDCSKPFGWPYMFSDKNKRLSRREKRCKKGHHQSVCYGSTSRTLARWQQISGSCSFSAIHLGQSNACDICPAIGWDNVENRSGLIQHVPWGCLGDNVSWDKRHAAGRSWDWGTDTYLTRRKYNRGRVTKTANVTIHGLYERATDLGFHVPVGTVIF
jgi:cellulose synthase/poly-beta-1,6-N-acetylglucosamine synthase-like glycosyltransferase